MSLEINKHDAIRNLYPSVETIYAGVCYDSDGNTVGVNESDVNAEISRMQADYDAKDYQRKRAAEYPPMADYLDGVVKGDQAQIDKYIADCNAVKAKYPKPS